jgi:hypothetical protein
MQSDDGPTRIVSEGYCRPCDDCDDHDDWDD